MQKVIRRTVRAERQAARRLKAMKDKEQADTETMRRNQARVHMKSISNDIKTARRVRREDLDLGPLAPRRDVGDSRETYGTIDSLRMRGRDLSMTERKTILDAWGGKLLNIVKGDRVVLLSGRDEGKIGVVDAVDTERCEVTVANLNLVDIAVPQWMRDADQGNAAPIRTQPKPVSLASVKLVHALTDPSTGLTRDVIVKRVENTAIWRDRTTKLLKWTRVIPGLPGARIPWPQREPAEHAVHDGDTLRDGTEQATFVPSLLRPPMPLGVIDELRNKYSRFRTRHDDDYVARKTAEDAETQRKTVLAKLMRTPLQELHVRERRAKRAKGKPRLTNEMLEKIGEVMAKNGTKSLGAMGVVKESSFLSI